MSKHHVTITLGGRSGQVVRQGGAGLEDASSNTRNKPSIRDRLGCNVASSSFSSSKRNRLGGNGSGLSAENNGSGAQLGRNDLRLKLMRKTIFKQTQGGAKKDLREMLSRTTRSPGIVDMHHKSELKESRVLRQVSSTRSVDNTVQVESSRRSYSSMTMDAYRPRAPDRVSVNYKESSPQRNIDDPRRVPVRTMDASRNPSSMNINMMRQVPTRTEIDSLRHWMMSTNGVYEPPGQVKPSSVAMQDALEVSRSVSHMPPLRPPPPQAQAQTQVPTTNVVVIRNSYMGDNVCDLLHSLGLGKYYINFQAEEVDMTALRQMGDNDLKEMGLPMGPRKKILLALMPPSRRPLQ